MQAHRPARIAHIQRRLVLLLILLGVLALLTYALGKRQGHVLPDLAVWRSRFQQAQAAYDDRIGNVEQANEQKYIPTGCPAILEARYGADRFTRVPWQTNNANVTFPDGLPVEDAHLCDARLSLNKVAVIVEMLEDVTLVPQILHFIEQLDDDWPVVLYHSRFNEEFILNDTTLRPYLLSGKVQRIQLQTAFLSHDAVSQFLAHSPLYEHLAPATHILMFQTDSTLCSASSQKIEDYFIYDFIGAPIHETIVNETMPLFNGGLSLRNRTAMLQIIEEAQPFDQPGHPHPWEDQFFSYEMARSNYTYHLPTAEQAAAFAVESVFHPTPLGVHRPHMFIHQTAGHEEYEQLRSYCPEVSHMLMRYGPTIFDPCENDPESKECALHRFTIAAEEKKVKEVVACLTEPDGDICREVQMRAEAQTAALV